MRSAMAGATKRFGLAGTEVVERPHPQHVEAVAEVGLQAEEVGGDLAGRVGRHRPQGRVLVDRELAQR